jgi:hypothetical protein
MLSVGTFVGALSGATIGDWLGRRWGLLGTCEARDRGAARLTRNPSFLLCFQCRCGDADHRNCYSALYGGTCYRRLWSWLAVSFGASIPERVQPKVDSGYHRCCVRF